MQNKEFNLVTADGTFLIGRFWKPDGRAIAIICLVHGIGEYSGRYDTWASRFCELGYLVFSVDLRGHGLSEGRRGHINHLSDYLDDIGSIVRRARHNREDLPVFLYGHSMGGNLALNFLLTKRQDFDGAIITAPWLRLVHPPNVFTQRLAGIFDKVCPKLLLRTGISSSQLTSNEEMQIESDKDEMMHGKISLRLFNILSKGATEVLSKSSGLNMPIFFGHGTRDDITAFEVTRNFSHKIGQNATFFSVAGARHELHHEPAADQLFAKLAYWIKATMKTSEKGLEHVV